MRWHFAAKLPFMFVFFNQNKVRDFCQRNEAIRYCGLDIFHQNIDSNEHVNQHSNQIRQRLTFDLTVQQRQFYVVCFSHQRTATAAIRRRGQLIYIHCECDVGTWRHSNDSTFKCK